jgi:uncharacterized membrane protein
MKPNKLLLALTLISFTATFFIYGKLPDQIPVHWGIDGEIDRYGGRYTAIVTGALGFILYMLMLVVPKVDPRKDSYEKHMGPYKILTLFLVLFMMGLHWVAMAFSLGYNIDIPFIMKLSMGLLFIVIGNYLPVIKPNYTLGIRIPWTLASEYVWEKTHKAGGYGFVVCGIIWFAFAFINQPWVFYMLMGVLFAFLGGVVVYSYLLFKKQVR